MSATTETMSPVEAAQFVLTRISPDCTWQQIMYHLSVRQRIEESLKAAEEGKFIDHDELFAELLAEDEDGEDEE